MWKFIFYTKISLPMLENKLEQYDLNRCFVDKVVLNYFFHFKNKHSKENESKSHHQNNDVTIKNYDPNIQSSYFAFFSDAKSSNSPHFYTLREKNKAREIKTVFCALGFELFKMCRKC